LVREEWNDPLTIIIVRSILTWNGTAPDRVPNLGQIICQYFWGAHGFSVWKHFSHDICVQTINNICLFKINAYTGRRNVTLAGVIQTPFDVAAKW